MNLDRFNKFQDLAGQAGLMFYYRGPFTSLVTQTVGEQIRNRLDSEGVAAPVKRKLFSSFVEMAQNVMHYGVPPEEIDAQAAAEPTSQNVGALALGTVEDEGGETETQKRHWIVCANLVKIADIPELTARLNQLRSMTAEEIKASYKRQLLNDEHQAESEASKGAGLGFLTIARDSRTPIEFSFVSDESTAAMHAYFLVRAVI